MNSVMTSTTIQSATSNARRMSSRIPPSLARLLILAAVSTTTPTPFHPHSSPYAFAAAAETASSTPTDVIVKTKSNNLLDAIGNKFESAAIATHNAIFQQAKEEESASLSSSSDDDVVGGLDSLEVSGVLPTHDPTTFYEPTESGNVMEAEEFIASPTQLPSSFPTLLLVKKSLTPTKHTDMHSPTLIITASTTFPTKKEDSPSQAPSQHITKSPTVLDETLTETVTSCPDLFDEAAFYIEDDIISTKGSLFCRSRDCRIIYKCSVPAFCNVVVPGKEHSEEGWLKLGYCGHVTFSSDGHTSMEDEEQDVADDELPSSFPTPLHVIDDAITTTQHHQGTEDFLGEEEAVPTSRPTSWQFGFNPVLPTPHKNDQDTAVHVDIPKIICDISLPSSLAENMEQSHVLLDVVTKTIYGIFESHLSNELYGLTGISLTVSTEKDLDNSSSSTIRLHAFFSGTASFSLVTPTQSDLIELLLLHFDVEYFNNRLNFPLRLHTMDKQPVVKVNAVFFKLEDGSLVNAGYKNAKDLALTAGKEAGLSVHQTQVITVFFVVAALPYVFVAIVLIMLRYMDEEEASAKPGTEEQQENDDSGKLDESVVKPSVELEIDIPWTLPPSDMSESGHNHDHSWWSSISDSLHDYTRDIESPAKVGLGITVAGHHYRQKDTLYGGRAATIGFVSELWEDHDQLEVYEDYVIDV